MPDDSWLELHSNRLFADRARVVSEVGDFLGIDLDVDQTAIDNVATPDSLLKARPDDSVAANEQRLGGVLLPRSMSRENGLVRRAPGCE